MVTTRLEAFSDGVLAIIITIMVLELRAPHGAALSDLRPMISVFFGYLLSFIYIGIYWNNHHHMMHVAKGVSGSILWANLHFLFWLSLVPFTTAWMAENRYESVPVSLYGFVLLMAAVAYLLLQYRILAQEGKDSVLRAAIGSDLKGKISPLLYVVAIFAAFIHPLISGVIYAGVALMWMIPDRRIEEKVAEEEEEEEASQKRGTRA
jgi:uncharacterized membrane protein